MVNQHSDAVNVTTNPYPFFLLSNLFKHGQVTSVRVVNFRNGMPKVQSLKQPESGGEDAFKVPTAPTKSNDDFRKMFLKQ